MPLKIFDVKIQATVVKTLRMEAENEKEAIELAHEEFTASPEEGQPEKYDEECLSCEEVPSTPSGSGSIIVKCGTGKSGTDVVIQTPGQG